MSVPEDTRQGTIDRREAIRRVTLLLGGVSLVGGSALLTACERSGKQPSSGGSTAFSDAEIALLDEIAETILPATSTPGAKAAETGAFMALMVTEAYDATDQQVFREGMRAVDDACRQAHDVGFMEATPAQRLAVLEPLDREQKQQSDAKSERDRLRGLENLSDERGEAAPVVDAATADEEPRHYFRMMKELALLGYFTSEIGCTQAQRYVESPGRFDPCAPYAPGERSWAPHA